ncbi:MAG: hypothetical protein P8184_08600 [Calditrichia bacterium]
MRAVLAKISLVGLLIWGFGLYAQTPSADQGQNTSTAGAAQAGVQASQEFQSVQSLLPESLKGLKVGGLFYISYQNGKEYTGTPDKTTPYSHFVLKRGYLDVQKTITPYLMGRYTTDITRDEFGDWKTRIKYIYGKFSWKGTSFITDLGMEFGQVHNPWLDFEESINGFRMQGTMFLERSGIFNSADMGVMVGSDLGGKMDASYRKKVNSHYAGRYGTWQAGIYDGSGYHAAEKNLNKVIGGRLTIRPLPDVLPGLQVSALGMTGKGNVAATAERPIPDWTVFDGMLSYQMPQFTGTAQYYRGRGNQSGSAIYDGKAREQRGYSFFGAVHFWEANRISVVGRYDYFDNNTDISSNDVQKRVIAGVAYEMYKGNTWLVDYQRVSHTADYIPAEDQFQVTLQVAF